MTATIGVFSLSRSKLKASGGFPRPSESLLNTLACSSKASLSKIENSSSDVCLKHESSCALLNLRLGLLFYSTVLV